MPLFRILFTLLGPWQKRQFINVDILAQSQFYPLALPISPPFCAFTWRDRSVSILFWLEGREGYKLGIGIGPLWQPTCPKSIAVDIHGFTFIMFILADRFIQMRNIKQFVIEGHQYSRKLARFSETTLVYKAEQRWNAQNEVQKSNNK